MGHRQREKEGMGDGGAESRGIFSAHKKRSRPPRELVLDYKDVDTLRPFMAEGGRIVPARVSRLNSKQQRHLAREIKRAQQLALLPASDAHRGLHG